MEVKIKLYTNSEKKNPTLDECYVLHEMEEVVSNLEEYRPKLTTWGGTWGYFSISHNGQILVVEHEDLWNFLFGRVVAGIESTLEGKAFSGYLMENNGKNYATEPLEDGNVLVYIWECVEGYMYSGGKDPNEPRDVLQKIILPAEEYYRQAFGCAMEFWEYQRLLSGEENANRVRPFLDEVRIKLIERGILEVE